MKKNLRFRLVLLIGIAVGLWVITSAQMAFAKNDKTQDYIITFKDGVDVDSASDQVANAHGLGKKGSFKHALHGMVATVPDSQLDALRNDPLVASVEFDAPVSVSAQTIPTGISRIAANTNPNLTINGQDDLRVDVDVAVIDTGIDM